MTRKLPVTIVSGLPRSGTSMMMRMLEAGGIPVLADNIRTADEDNPNGYYEFEAVKSTKTNARWVEEAVGKAVKMVHLLLYDLPSDYEYRVLFMQRRPEEIVASQSAMLQRTGKTGGLLSSDLLMAQYNKQMDAILRWLKEQPNFSVLEISYNEILGGCEPIIDAICTFLGQLLDRDVMKDVIDLRLYRQRSTLRRDREIESDEIRPLPVLRALIDSVDHELLRLLARRNGLVTEVAAYKRQNRMAIRDPQREREIITDRRDRATPLGLTPDTIESLFRLMLWASRDRQAALGAELPPDIELKTVAIIGGHGAMGRLMASLFADLGQAVMIADVDTKLSPAEAATLADVVIISVPIEVTVDIIREVGPRVREDAVLADVTSIKLAPVRAMLENTKASVVGTHPLFGPSVHSLQGQRLALVPARGAEWATWFTQMFAARGMNVIETNAEQHDQIMAIVQVLTHFSTEVAGMAMANLNVPLSETLRFTSPVYMMELLMTARHFAQDPDLYASIQMSNPRTHEVTAAFEQAAAKWCQVISTGNRDAVRSAFEQVRQYLGDFTDQAMNQSSYLIDRLVERM